MAEPKTSWQSQENVSERGTLEELDALVGAYNKLSYVVLFAIYGWMPVLLLFNHVDTLLVIGSGLFIISTTSSYGVLLYARAMREDPKSLIAVSILTSFCLAVPLGIGIWMQGNLKKRIIDRYHIARDGSGFSKTHLEHIRQSLRADRDLSLATTPSDQQKDI